MGKIDLPSGGWALLREPNEITNRERRALALGFVRDDRPEAEKAISFPDEVIALFVTEWSYGAPLPKDNLDVLLDISCHDYDTLNHFAVQAQKAMVLRFDPNPDPKALTGPSSV